MCCGMVAKGESHPCQASTGATERTMALWNVPVDEGTGLVLSGENKLGALLWRIQMSLNR